MSDVFETPETGHQGFSVDGDDPVVLSKAIDLAFDYRGDVTVECDGHDEPIAGYLFDRRVAEPVEDSVIRLIPDRDADRVTVRYADIQRLTFSGRDTAAGKSFDTWMRKYVEKKLAGEIASIESEPLE
jgi:hypothetical protein